MHVEYALIVTLKKLGIEIAKHDMIVVKTEWGRALISALACLRSRVSRDSFPNLPFPKT
jgi:hypothetical protein